MDYFETSVVINKDTLKELKRYRRRTRDKVIFALASLSSCYVVIRGIITQNATTTIAGIALILLAILVRLRDEVTDKRSWRQIKESSGTTELEIEQVASFLDDGIRAHNPQTNGTVNFRYDIITEFAETKNLYFFRTKAHQFILANKAHLIEEQKNEEFLHFIKSKCENVRWRTQK